MRTPNTDAGHLVVAGDHNRATLQAQLAKVLESSHFRNSKRSQSLLRFVVETAIAGDQNSLKERSVGAAVFGRDTAYDTAQDPIVRNAAIEVRKRLAQYYLEPEHAGELRIELPTGSYMPTFSAEVPPAAAEPDPLVVVAPPAETPAAAAREGTSAVNHSRRWMAGLALLALLGIALALFWITRRSPASELEAFWEPLFRDRTAIPVCVGQPTRLYRFIGPRTEELNRQLGGPPSPNRAKPEMSVGSDELTWVAPEYLFSRDAMSAFKIASWIQSKGRPYQMMSVSQADYSRIRRVPLVAIGAFNNPWSMRVTAELRFVFSHRTIDGIAYNCIDDRRNPQTVPWKVTQPAAVATMPEDFAIVTRVFDPATERTVISAAGIETYGTLPASEFVTESEYLGAVLQAAPKEWRHKNLQFVLSTRIIDGTPGPPRVVATHLW